MIQTETIASIYAKSLQVSGVDANKFLQGQLTCDVNVTPTVGAYCNIKGKVECLFHLNANEHGFLLNMPESMLTQTISELQKYAVFSKVELAIVAEAPARDQKQEILDLIPEVYPETSGKFFPHDINLPQLKAVNFTKGCYRGQEIVARMQHRGNLKRSLRYFTSTNSLNPGDPVLTIDEKNVGTVVRTYNDHNSFIGLAVINNDIDHMQIAVLKLDRSL